MRVPIQLLRTWGPLIASFAAVVVAVFALQQTRSAQQTDDFYKEISIAPVLELRYDFDNGINVKVVNEGAGTAVIRDVRPGKISVSKRIFETYGDAAVKKVGECSSMKYPEYSSTRFGYVPTGTVRPGDSLSLYTVEFKGTDNQDVKFSKEQSSSYFDCLDDTNIQLCYCSLSGKTCQMLSTRGYFDSGFVCGNNVAAPE